MFRIDRKKITGCRVHTDHVDVSVGPDSLLLPDRTTHYIEHEDDLLHLGEGGLGVTLRKINIEAINLKLEGDYYVTDNPVIISGEFTQRSTGAECIDALLYRLFREKAEVKFTFEGNKFISGYITEISMPFVPDSLAEKDIKITLMSLS